MPTLTVIIPSYNEAATLPRLLDAVSCAVLPGRYGKQIILVDDASTDSTPSVAVRYMREHPDCPLTYLRHTRNSGKGRAIRTAIAQATGEYTIIQDADLEYFPDDYAALLNYALAHQCPVVYGSRFLLKSNRHSYVAFYWGGRLVTWVANLLYGLQLTDEPTCYKLFSTPLLRSLPLRCEGFEFCPEVTARVARRGIKIPEVPIRYAPRSIEEGKKINWRDGLCAIFTLLRYRLGG